MSWLAKNAAVVMVASSFAYLVSTVVLTFAIRGVVDDWEQEKTREAVELRRDCDMVKGKVVGNVCHVPGYEPVEVMR